VKLALEAETAITQLLILDHEYYRKQVADSIETPHAPDEPHSFLQYKLRNTKIKIHKTTSRTMKQWLKKLIKEILQSFYTTKSSYTTLQRKNTKLCNWKSLLNHQHRPNENFPTSNQKDNKPKKTLISQDSKWKYLKLNPSVPTKQGLIKFHKPNQPIHPIVVVVVLLALQRIVVVFFTAW